MSTFIELTGSGDNLPIAVNMDTVLEVVGLPNGCSELVHEYTRRGFRGVMVTEPIGKVMQLWKEAQKK